MKTTYQRNRDTSKLMLVALIVIWATVLGCGSSANATDQYTIDLPAGLACSNFGLHIEVTGSKNPVYREFVDENGTLVRILSAGKGNALTFTNTSTNSTFSLRPNGSVAHVTVNPDGSSTWVTTGHYVLILFPTDNPPGPSTKQYVGRVVFTDDGFFNYTLQEVSGKENDICAALAE